MYSEVFDWYVTDNSGKMSRESFRHVLRDLGLLEHQPDPAAFVNASFKAADVQQDGALSREAFCAYYATLTTTKARQQLRAHMGLAVEGESHARK